jgi:hypothetical protein
MFTNWGLDMKGHLSLILGSLDFNKHPLNLKICMLNKGWPLNRQFIYYYNNEHFGIDHQGCKVH